MDDPHNFLYIRQRDVSIFVYRQFQYENRAISIPIILDGPALHMSFSSVTTSSSFPSFSPSSTGGNGLGGSSLTFFFVDGVYLSKQKSCPSLWLRYSNVFAFVHVVMTCLNFLYPVFYVAKCIQVYNKGSGMFGTLQNRCIYLSALGEVASSTLGEVVVPACIDISWP